MQLGEHHTRPHRVAVELPGKLLRRLDADPPILSERCLIAALGREPNHDVEVGARLPGGDEPAALRRERLADRAGEDQATLLEDHQPVGDLLDLGEQMAGDEDGDAARSKPAQEPAHVHDPGRVKAVDRLIQDQ